MIEKREIRHLPTSERLEALAEVVEKVGPRLNMWAWASRVDLTPEDLFYERVEEHPCGTAACALGTAAVCFEGLELQVYGWGNVVIVVDEHGEQSMTHNEYERPWHTGARNFFGITAYEARFLFMPASYRDTSAPIVASRIRALAAQYRERGR